MRSRLLLPALVALAALAAAAPASASTLTRAGGVYDYTGTAAVNSMSITASPGSVNISDSEPITMAADASCTGENTTSIQCTVTPTNIDFDLGGNADNGGVNVSGITTAFPITGQTGSGNDSASISATFGVSAASTATLDDSAGNDTISVTAVAISGVNTFGYGTANGGSGADTVSSTGTANGDGGADIVRGINAGTTVTVNGGTENDTFQPNSDSTPEIFNGGGGTDLVDYRQVSNATVSLDGVLNDGITGGSSQNDNVNADLLVENVTTGDTADVVTGGSGNNVLITGGGNDTINGAGGDDSIDAGFGADLVNGGSNGAGGDTLTYADRSQPLRGTMDGIAANDGEAGEFDDIEADVENIIGGFATDSFSGNESANNLNGGLGEDSFSGLGGPDTVIGGSGDDNLDGGAGNDNVDGGPGDDTVDGAADADTVNGGDGADLLDGSSGADTLNGGNGPDTVLAKDNAVDTAINCGDGTDHAVRDVADPAANADCEISDTGAAGFDSARTETARDDASAPVSAPASADDGGGKPAVVTCTVSRTKRGARVKCRVSGADGALSARLVRGRRVFARAKRNGSGRMTLRASKRAGKGRYTVVVTQGGRAIARLRVKV